MNKILLFAASNQTILNAVAIKEEHFKTEDVDLFIIVQLNSAGFDYDLYSIIAQKNIFKRIFVIDKKELEIYLNSVMNSKLKKLFYCWYLEKYLQIKLQFLANEHYEKIICPMFYHYIPNIINAIKNIQNTKKLSISFYEEGTASYAFSIKGLALFNVFLIKFPLQSASLMKKIKTTVKYYFNEVVFYYKLKKYIDNKLYIYWPQHLKFNEIIPVKLDYVSKTADLKDVYETYSKKLDYVKINRYRKSRIIFLTCYILGTDEIQFEIIKRILGKVSYCNFILKTHPGSTKNREHFADNMNERIYVDRDAYYFDALNLQVDFSEKIIVTVDSSAIMNFKNIFNVEPYVIFLYKLTNNYYTDTVYRENADRYIKDLKDTFNNTVKIAVPNSVYEFDYYFDLFKVEIDKNELKESRLKNGNTSFEN